MKNGGNDRHCIEGFRDVFSDVLKSKQNPEKHDSETKKSGQNHPPWLTLFVLSVLFRWVLPARRTSIADFQHFKSTIGAIPSGLQIRIIIAGFFRAGFVPVLIIVVGSHEKSTFGLLNFDVVSRVCNSGCRNKSSSFPWRLPRRSISSG